MEKSTTAAILSPIEFKEFYEFLNILKDDFNDLFICQGIFRTRSNKLNCIVETGFKIFENLQFSISKIKNLINMISLLEKGSDITICVDDNSVEFKDNCQKIAFTMPPIEFMDNKYVSDQEMDQIFLSKIDPDKLFIDEIIPNNYLIRLKKAAK